MGHLGVGDLVTELNINKGVNIEVDINKKSKEVILTINKLYLVLIKAQGHYFLASERKIRILCKYALCFIKVLES